MLERLLMAQTGISQVAEEALVMDLNPCARRSMSSLVVARQVWIIGKGVGRSRLLSEICPAVSVVENCITKLVLEVRKVQERLVGSGEGEIHLRLSMSIASDSGFVNLETDHGSCE